MASMAHKWPLRLPQADTGARLAFGAVLWPFQAWHLGGGPEGPCFQLLEAFAPKQIKGLDPVRSVAERASWAFCVCHQGDSQALRVNGDVLIPVFPFVAR